MKAKAIVATSLLLLVALLAFVPPAQSESSLRVVAMGDTSANSATQKNVDGALADGATTFIGLGDYNYDHSVSAWRSMFAPLKTKYLALGNHDDRYALSEYFPDGSRWSKSVNGVRIVALNGMDPVDTTRLRSDLCNAPESMRVVIVHHNWWLGSAAHHPGSEFEASPSTMDAILRDCGVDLVLAGHEHNYQRMERNGIPYVIVGTGGRGLYPVEGSPSGTVKTCECLGRLMLDLGPSGYSAQFKALDGTVKDSFSRGSAAPAPQPVPEPSSDAVSFAPGGGNGWWVEVDVDGPVTAVDARDTDGAWVPLAKKSWGDWAASFRVESGHDVQYRARTSDGSVVESCWYDHPDGGCVTSAPAPEPEPAPAPEPTPTPSTGVTFAHEGGNEWWVQADVEGSVTRVDARDTNGAWVALAKKSWGDWAGSFRVESGHDVQYRATTSSGATVESCWFDHPKTTCVTGTAPAPQPEPQPQPEPDVGGFVATFDNVRGNGWWVEADVSAEGGTLAKVEARADSGSWVALEKKSWGSYAKSMRAVSTVELRATSTDGQVHASSPYAWPPA